jgi:hypothetical protein
VRCSLNVQRALGGDNYFIWSIVSDKTSDLKLIELPDDLITRFPGIEGELTVEGFGLLVTPDPYTYQNMVADEFSGLAEKTVLSEKMEIL